MPPVKSSDGPVAVTGASGYVGAHVVIALMKRGYEVRACVTDLNNPDKTDHLKALNDAGHPGSLELFSGNLLQAGSYDKTFDGCTAVLHVGTAMGYGNANNPRQVYDGAINGTQNVLGSVKKSRQRQAFYLHEFLCRHRSPIPAGLQVHGKGLGFGQPRE